MDKKQRFFPLLSSYIYSDTEDQKQIPKNNSIKRKDIHVEIEIYHPKQYKALC